MSVLKEDPEYEKFKMYIGARPPGVEDDWHLPETRNRVKDAARETLLMTLYKEYKEQKGSVSWKECFPFVVVDFAKMASPYDMPGIADKAEHILQIKADPDLAPGYFPEHESPMGMYRQVILIKALTGADNGDHEAVKFLRDLYKRYYPREWKIIKKFKQLTPDDIEDILGKDEYAEKDKDGTLVYAMARIVMIATLNGCELLDCDILIFWMWYMWREYCKSTEDARETAMQVYANVEADAFEALQDIEDAIQDEDTDEGIYDTLMVFAEEAERISGLPAHTIVPFNGGAMSEDMGVASNISMINAAEVSIDTLQAETLIWQIIERASLHISESRSILRDLLDRDETDTLPPEENDAPDVRAVTKPVETPANELTDLRKETQSLRDRLHRAEQLVAEFAARAKDAERRSRELEAEKEALEEELAALTQARETCREEDAPEQAVTPDEQIRYLASKKIICIGGNQNWVKKIKQVLPGWTYVDIRYRNPVDVSVVKNADYVLLNDKCASHSLYEMFKAAALKWNVPFLYFNGVNLDIAIGRIYDSITDWERTNKKVEE